MSVLEVPSFADFIHRENKIAFIGEIVDRDEVKNERRSTYTARFRR